ncbi:MAG: phage tail protein [Desertifilum sp. SIO1I2]|nr:phage tail protein [Desertifilum sp. SIO1I2]
MTGRIIQNNNGNTQNSQRDVNGREIQALNYVTANRFYVEIESQITASFSECQGLGVKIKYERYQEGGVNDQQRIILGQSEFSDVTLKRGLTNDLVFIDWISKILVQLVDRPLDTRQLRQQESLDIQPARTQSSDRAMRRNVNILIFNQAGETMQCWTLIGAVPVGWKAPSLQANSNTVAIEELTLAYEGLKVMNAGFDQRNSRGGGAYLHSNGRDSQGYFSSY